MANILSRLINSVNKKTPVQGKVVSVRGGVVTVSTFAGVQEMANVGSTNLRAGDSVKLNGSNVIGRIGSEDSLPVYRL